MAFGNVPGGGLGPAALPQNAAPQKIPQKGGFLNSVGNLLNNPFLMNILAQQGGTLPAMTGTTGPGPLATVGRAFLATQQQEQQAGLSSAREELLRAQAGLAKRKTEAGGTLGATNVQSQFVTKDNKLGFLRRNGERVITDIDVKENFSIRSLPDGSQVAVSNSDPEEVLPVITPEQARDATVRQATNAERAAATTELPKAEAKAESVLDSLDELENHPGLPSAVGVKGASQLGGLLPQPLPGSQAADFLALRDQVSGSVFLEAFQDLKGGGHITEIEGQKAEQAIARIRDVNQSEKGYKQAIADLREVIKNGLDRKRRAAGRDTSKPLSEMTDAELEEIARGGNP